MTDPKRKGLFPADRVADFYREGWWNGDTWGDYIRRNVTRFGSSEAVVDAPDKNSFMPGEVRRLTWNELDSAVTNCAQVFYRNGLRPGDVVGVQVPNSIELIVSYLALSRIGCVLSPYPMAYRTHEIAQLADIAKICAIVTLDGFASRNVLRDLGEVADSLESIVRVFAWHHTSEPTCATDVVALPEEILAKTVDDTDAEYYQFLGGFRPDPNECAIIIFTSGTTGPPKGVPRAYGDSVVGALSTTMSPQLTHQDCILAPMPMVNAGAIVGVFLPWVITGCKLVLHQPFHMDTWLGQIADEAVTYTLVAPTLLNDIAGNPALVDEYDLSSLRVIGSGSAPLSGWSIRYWETTLGVEVLNLFGASEGLQLFSDPDTVPDPELRARGIPLPGSKLFHWRTDVGRCSKARLVNPDTGETITAPGIPGELHVKGPNLFSGYLNAESPFDDDGYLRTGDIFEFSADQPDLLIHIDRLKDLIIRGGMNISAAEIESLLISHPKVAEVAAVGEKDVRLGEKTCVIVVPADEHDPPSLQELVDYLDCSDVAKFKWPERLILAGELPRNPTGKVLKRTLRAQINHDGGGSV